MQDLLVGRRRSYPGVPLRRPEQETLLDGQRCLKARGKRWSAPKIQWDMVKASSLQQDGTKTANKSDNTTSTSEAVRAAPWVLHFEQLPFHALCFCPPCELHSTEQSWLANDTGAHS